ncbi:MAG TPA: hypothetical protein VHU23_07025 [Rhizomicrobium sp.]|nr:hypothetical protein [Rhizomicrobium sp.]
MADDGHRVCLYPQSPDRNAQSVDDSAALARIFVLSRVPDGFHMHFSDQFLADMLWSLVITALIVPDLILTTRELTRLASRRRARGAVPAFAG